MKFPNVCVHFFYFWNSLITIYCSPRFDSQFNLSIYGVYFLMYIIEVTDWAEISFSIIHPKLNPVLLHVTTCWIHLLIDSLDNFFASHFPISKFMLLSMRKSLMSRYAMILSVASSKLKCSRLIMFAAPAIRWQNCWAKLILSVSIWLYIGNLCS